ncbi:hypothetical protein L916_10031, partial [Phytophthora nicotianae]
MSITAKDKTTIADVNAEITEYFKTKDVGCERFILAIMVAKGMVCKTFRIIEQLSTESIIKK